MTGAPLRFGVMTRGTTLAAWQAEAIRSLVASGVAELAVRIDDATPRSAASAGGRLGKAARLLTEPELRRTLLWKLYERLDRPRALDPVAGTTIFEGIPAIACAVRRKGRFSEYFDDGDIARIRAYDCDFILRFAFGIVRGEILQAARYGVWSFHHGDELRYRGGPPCFWEIYRGDPVSGAILQRLTERLDGGVVLRKGFLRTIDYSYGRNVDQLFFETAKWPAYAAREIVAGSTERVSAPPSATDAPIDVLPGNLQMLRFGPRIVRNVMRRLSARKLDEEWNVGIARATPGDVLEGKPLRDVRWIDLPADGWVADPMALDGGGRVDVLCERMFRADGKAQIAATSFDGNAWSPLTPAISTPTHASYPYLVRENGTIYCVPETFEAGAVTLYRAKSFPHDWEPAAQLLEGFPAVDPTIFRYDGRWWLFCTTQESSGSTLLAFYADAVEGPWEPHAANPVKIDIRGARPAGPPFLRDGILYRPAQDSSRTYGGRVAIQRVVELTTTRFEEEPCAYVEPDPLARWNRGLHTLSFAGEYCVIDGKRWVR